MYPDQSDLSVTLEFTRNATVVWIGSKNVSLIYVDRPWQVRIDAF